MPECYECNEQGADKECQVGHWFHSEGECETEHLPWCNEKQKEIIALWRQGLRRGEIRTKVRLRPSEIREYLRVGLEPTDEPEQVEAEVDTIGLERDLQRALRANLQRLEEGLVIADAGKEKEVPSGYIDILAKDNEGTSVVIELKVGTADRDAIAQVLSYMGDLEMNDRCRVRGIVVACDFKPRAIAAARAANISLCKYAFNFSFEQVEKHDKVTLADAMPQAATT